MKSKKKKQVFWVAYDPRSKTYARRGRDQDIDDTKDIWQAEQCGSPAGIMRWMGGHYSGYVPLKIVVNSILTVKGKGKYPPAESVFE